MAEPTLKGFIRHAERFGTECVFETAQEFLNNADLVELSASMSKLGWNPPKLFILNLFEKGWSKSKICKSGISRPTLDQWLKQAEKRAKNVKYSGGLGCRSSFCVSGVHDMN